jgi:hypothetical protein
MTLPTNGVSMKLVDLAAAVGFFLTVPGLPVLLLVLVRLS